MRKLFNYLKGLPVFQGKKGEHFSIFLLAWFLTGIVAIFYVIFFYFPFSETDSPLGDDNLYFWVFSLCRYPSFPWCVWILAFLDLKVLAAGVVLFGVPGGLFWLSLKVKDKRTAKGLCFLSGAIYAVFCWSYSYDCRYGHLKRTTLSIPL